MAAAERNSAIQRKMAAGQEGTQPGGRPALRALRLGLARAARDLFELPLAVIGATQARLGQSALEGHLDGDRRHDQPRGGCGARYGQMLYRRLRRDSH